ncbi:MAG: hypothetical protein NTX03_13385 [Bacteroidetes bacterium]|nr:hypothetical protein [Bacteroidota bacterium]
MRYTIQIDDSTNVGKNILGIIQSLIKDNKGIEVISEEEIEKREDMLLAKMMKESAKSGRADTDAVLRKLGIK